MPSDIDRCYIERHFWKLHELAEAVGVSIERVEALIAAQCAPGPIYVLGEAGWWSALSDQPAPAGKAWYSPGSAWGLRRAVLAVRSGASDVEAAALLERIFQKAFVEALAETDGAALAFPDCFDCGDLDAAAASRAARREWAAWLTGGYGVCLRIFTGSSCVTKEALGASLKASLASGDYDPTLLLAAAEKLAEIILPFAPWQRPSGTPGRTIDRLLLEQGLGHEHPYPCPYACHQRHECAVTLNRTTLPETGHSLNGEFLEK
jgi:hypothetical protein